MNKAFCCTKSSFRENNAFGNLFFKFSKPISSSSAKAIKQTPLWVEATIIFPNGLSAKLKLISRFLPPFLYSAGVIPSMFTNKSCKRLVPESPVSKAASNKVA